MPSATASRDGRPPLRLDFVSPLPPVRSGIADYATDLLPDLAARCDVRLVRLPGQPVAPEIEARWPVVDVSALDPSRLALYQMGNNPYHEPVLELAMRQPGIVTLHDVLLHHLLLEVTLGRGDFEAYRERLREDYGWVGEAVATAKRWGAWGTAPVFALPALRSMLRRQRGVVVHSAWGAGMLQEEAPEVRVRAIRMGIPLPPLPDPAAAREWRLRHGIPAAAPLLGSFGFQTPIKRTEAVVRALAAPELAAVHLVVAGQTSGVDLEGEAAAAGVADRVHVIGFLPFAEFETAIAAVDLCLNLRYPTAGETSASLLRIFALGRPAVISDYAQFAELPPEVAVRVPLGDEERPALVAALDRLLSRRDALRTMGEAARAYVERCHRPADAAEDLVEVCREWAALDPPGAHAIVAPPPTSLVWGRLPGELEVEGAELPWAPGERRTLRLRLRNHGPAIWCAGGSGPGGVAVVVKLIAEGRDLLADRAWLPLPRDLGPGEELVLETAVRRPSGPPSPVRPAGVPRLPVPPETIRLWIEPHLFGGVALSEMGGPRWELDL